MKLELKWILIYEENNLAQLDHRLRWGCIAGLDTVRHSLRKTGIFSNTYTITSHVITVEHWMIASTAVPSSDYTVSIICPPCIKLITKWNTWFSWKPKTNKIDLQCWYCYYSHRLLMLKMWTIVSSRWWLQIAKGSRDRKRSMFQGGRWKKKRSMWTQWPLFFIMSSLSLFCFLKCCPQPDSLLWCADPLSFFLAHYKWGWQPGRK